MVDPDSDKVSRASPYSGTASRSLHHFVYGAFTLSRRPSQNRSTMLKFSRTPRVAPKRPYNPTRRWFGLFQFRSPLLSESLLFSLPEVHEMVQFPQFRFRRLCIQRPDDRLSSAGLPHSAIQGSRDVCSSPWLFAACHGLLRLVTPRHPP